MPYLLLLVALVFAASPYLTPGFGGFEADQFPVPQVDPPGQPAGYAFAIWGVIYVWLIVGMGFQALRRRDAGDWAALRPPLLISLGIGAAWLAVALVSPVWATVMIWLMWGGAVLALIRAPVRDAAFGWGPVGLYAGWLTAASCVSIALLLAGYGVTDAVTAALIALVLALLLTLAVMRLRPEAISYPAAAIWALIAVAVANWPDGPVAVLALSLGGAALIAGAAALLYARA